MTDWAVSARAATATGAEMTKIKKNTRKRNSGGKVEEKETEQSRAGGSTDRWSLRVSEQR